MPSSPMLSPMTKIVSIGARANVAAVPVDAPAHVDPVQWHQSIGYARQVCARFFRDGATPADAMRAFGLAVKAGDPAEWGRAVGTIAHAICAEPRRRMAA